MAKNFDRVKDSGERRDFGTGSVRDMSGGKGRFDLLPMLSIFRIAKHFENGAKKYKPRNWENGIPLSCFWDSAFRHLLKVMLGMTDEDHEAAVLWNISCFIETKERIDLGVLPKELDDMPDTFSDPKVQEKLVKMFEGSIQAALGTDRPEEDEEPVESEVVKLEE